MKATLNFVRDYVPRDEIIKELGHIGGLSGLQRSLVDSENAHAEYFDVGDDKLRVGVIAPYSRGWPCAREECGRLRIGPTGIIKSCVYDRTETLTGLGNDEKSELIGRLIDIKISRIDEDRFPKRHRPAYMQLRFGQE